MMAGFNDRLDGRAARLFALLQGSSERAKVNLIPYNENPDRPDDPPAVHPKQVKAFQHAPGRQPGDATARSAPPGASTSRRRAASSGKGEVAAGPGRSRRSADVAAGSLAVSGVQDQPETLRTARLEGHVAHLRIGIIGGIGPV